MINENDVIKKGDVIVATVVEDTKQGEDISTDMFLMHSRDAKTFGALAVVGASAIVYGGIKLYCKCIDKITLKIIEHREKKLLEKKEDMRKIKVTEGEVKNENFIKRFGETE